MEKEILESLLYSYIFHFIGDYVLQSDYIATTKGKNWYHLFVHCILYISPFLIYYGINDCLWYFLFIPHFIIDACKARFGIIDYFTNQLLHLMCVTLYGLCIWCYI